MIQFKRKTLSLAVAVTCAAVTAGAIASSHREAPNITRHPALDSTDFYAFNSYEQGREDYVTFIANYILQMVHKQLLFRSSRHQRKGLQTCHRNGKNAQGGASAKHLEYHSDNF